MTDILYTCRACSLYDIKINVRFRKSNEDIIHWMNHAVIPLISDDHHKRSPICAVTTLTDIKIPLPHGIEMIGGIVKH